ncbi:glycosyltransferase family 4 protein [Kocuria sp. HSID16901]|uniref:glycosyltransferase family 4 protein n=1 Tax=Kocuria sp. HSID16901 TaxID=2419505 RepID=UPI00080A92B8|nr:glycosyltransferase family 1 protein [Kocuria sp. HSID16901]
MRILMVAESFVPHLSGVTTSLLRSAENLRRRGHEVMFLAPSGRGFKPSDWSPTVLPSLPRAVHDDAFPASRQTPESCPISLAPGQTYEEVEGTPTVRMPSLPLAGYPTLRFSMGTVAAVRRLMADYRPDVVHIASPFVLGARAVTAAHSLGIPSVAVYQTDVAAYTHRYGMPWLKAYANKRIASIHTTATMTLAPSHSSMDYLESLEVPRVFKWGRGVDTELFHPRRRSEAVRQKLGADSGDILVGFVGRLASEKQVEDLRVIQSLPGVKLVIIGGGPELSRLKTTLHQAIFTGQLTGESLAEHVASLDVFTHPGEFETFGQTLQEAMASGVATVAVGKGGPLDIIDDGVTGRLYEPGQLGMLRTIVESLRDPEARAPLSTNGRQAMEARSWGAASLKLEGYYDRAIEFHRSRQLRRWRDERGAQRRGPGRAASRHRV